MRFVVVASILLNLLVKQKNSQIYQDREKNNF